DTPFATFLDRVYEEPGIEKKRDLLDDFFLALYQPFPEISLTRAVDILQNRGEPIKVGELAEELGLSRRTLLRKFKRHTGYSIEEYISTIKFRKALLNYQKNQDSPPLTQIALESHYYDQADFNRSIKHRSELTPSELFRQLNIVDNTLFWKL
ncbi:MAG: helix-turn-helix domain-containing protein, partial [Bacteroidota bacterium]